MRIYGNMTSGNCHKVRWTADRIGMAYEWREVNSLDGATRSAEFRSLNPMAQVPVVEFGDGRRLAQSNAIIRYLARGTQLLPDDPWQQAKADEWLFWEQYSHEPYVAVCRSQMVYQGKAVSEREGWRVERGEAALDLMERHLASRSWLTDAGFTVADISLLAYTRLAAEGGFDLATRPSVREWIARCEAELDLAPNAAQTS